MLNEAAFVNSDNSYQFGLRISERGFVQGVGDGIALVSGLPSAEIEEIIEFEDGSTGLVFQLAVHSVGVVLLSQTHELTAGMQAHRTRKRLQIGVGDSLLGRVIDPLGTPLDGMAKAYTANTRSLEASSPSILERDFVTDPLYTGNKIVDTMIPIGKGQRQLIVGDNGVGKSSFALDVIINQRNRGVNCVLVLVGQTRATVAATVDILAHYSALEYTVVVIAEANALAGFRYLAPFAGCAIAEHWMRMGRDTLVIYDDLTLHAQSYRELSLLLQRPPGREAYPSDIFHLHSRLLERSTVLSPEKGGGSMTALPIVQTRLGEIAAYIPTNLISITDGQIYFDSKLFASGHMPAIDIGRSVSRIGGKAQHPSIKNAAARIRLDYLQFLELELFARFGTRLEESVQAKLKRGQVLREILKQDRLSPLSEEAHMAWLQAYETGLLDGYDPLQIAKALPKLFEAAEVHGLSLDDPQERWSLVLRDAIEAKI